ncbi:MAG TPA: BlaI/MecI/CopY family transcriptional regulator [Arenimonas sp.]|nr:BlaI/MecI/CopY family transcriptional regulator [Arenimonas sp.]
MTQKNIRKPTASELNLLKVLWPLGQATVKQVHEAAQKENPDIAYASVLRLMQIMHAKGLLTRDETERSHIYAPSQAQGAIRTNLLNELINKAFAGSGKDLVMAALSGHVSQQERDEIQKILRGETP